MDLEHKKAHTSVEIHPLLAWRWSPRSFIDTVPDKEVLTGLFEAARWSPSSANEQPWHFIAGIKGESDSWDKVFSCLDDYNQEWCIFAPVLLLSVARKYFHKNNEPNRHYAYDTGQAVAHLSFQASSENLYVHQMGGFFQEKAIEIFNIPDGHEVMSAIAIGYIDSPEKLSKKNAAQEGKARIRKRLKEMIFINKWGDFYL